MFKTPIHTYLFVYGLSEFTDTHYGIIQSIYSSFSYIGSNYTWASFQRFSEISNFVSRVLQLISQPGYVPHI